MPKTLFDTYLFVDWSSKASLTSPNPQKDAVWLGVFGSADDEPETTYCRGRQVGAEEIRRRLVDWVEEGRRVLLGFDLPYGYPAGTAQALGLDGVPWRAMWRLLEESIEDDSRNRNNRFEVATELNRRVRGDRPGPFWGCHPNRASSMLTSKRKGFFKFPYDTGERLLENRRVAERWMKGTQEVWKLMGNGSVGSQVLMGIPYLSRLRFDPQLTAHSLVWPFESRFMDGFPEAGDQRPLVFHVECWPGLVEDRVKALDGSGRIRDEIQMAELCRWARQEDRAGRLADRLAAPDGLFADELKRVIDEEGWTLGAG